MVNINVGVLGHVDSGKTSLCKAMSQQGSTAAFDKHPQSKERGITIDLGFSTFSQTGPNGEEIQFTLVDCPGHASLIKTVIGGAQIIDVMLLVIDVTKGIQTQTAECLIIGEICCDHMIVVLNKTDLLDSKGGDIEQMRSKVRRALQKTKFKEADIVSTSANLPGSDGVIELKKLLGDTVRISERDPEGPLVFFVDHCFQIKGQGTILTGTINQGRLITNMMIDVPALNIQRKVKSLQVFRKSVTEAIQGDRVGACVTQFDADLFERGVICSPGYLRSTYAVILPLTKIPYFKQEIRSGSKFHITAVHETVLAKITLFSSKVENPNLLETEFKYEEKLEDDMSMFGLLEFEQPMISGAEILHLASKLDTDINGKSCRLAFYGKAVKVFNEASFRTHLRSVKIYKNKMKSGSVDRMANDTDIIVKNLFKKETLIDTFKGMKVLFSSGERGIIQDAFGQSGKVRVSLELGTQPSAELLKYKAKKIEGDPVTVKLEFKRFIFDPDKKMFQ